MLLDVSAVPSRPVGAGVYTIQIARALDAHPEVDLLLAARSDDEQRWSVIAPHSAVAAEVPARRPQRILWEQTKAPKLAKRMNADLWHGPHYTMPARLHIPSVVTIHDLTFFDHPEWHEKSKVLFFRRMIRSSARNASALICVSHHTKDRLTAVLDPSTPIYVASHGVDHARFQPLTRPEEIEADLNLLSHNGISPPYLAFVGTIEPRKDIPSLVKAFAEIADERPSLQLVIAGADGWGVTEVRDCVASSGYTTRILRPGYLPAEVLAPFLRRASVVAYPSLEEGFGLPALEALACGAPVVTTSGTAMAEVCGEAALLTPPAAPSELAAAIAGLIDDESAADHLRVAGPARASTFTWDRATTNHILAYRDAMDQAPKRVRKEAGK
ncbi:glycosyltransferase [Actinobacteria bacterium IMCC26256]|nr:glycosyltransferase [Actinobacteria bacterium IMCC26256]